MLLVGAVSLAAFVAIGVVSSSSLRANIDSALEEALQSNSMQFSIPELGGRGGGMEQPRSSSTVPVYCVTVTSTGAIYAENNQGASMDEDTLDAAVSAVLASGAKAGALTDYDLFYAMQEDLFGYRIAFADRSDFNRSLGSITLSLVGLWFALMVVFLIITLFLSRLVVKPVAQAWDDQQRFIADASHELKTPLTVILADASILQSHPQSTVAEQQMWLEGIQSEAERMQQLTENMLTLAQADAGADLKPVMSQIDFSEEVERSCLQFEAVAFERGITIQSDVAPGLQVMGDAARLQGLLKTLLENACKYCSEHGQIQVTLEQVRSSLRLTVTNDGQGIAPEDLPHVFDRFYRSDKSRAREGSSASFGLGLSIAKSTAELHGGTIGVTSAEGQTSFVVTLPLA